MTDRGGLVDAARHGDRVAFGELVELEAAEAIGLCRAILRSQADAEDAAQEAFIRAWRQLPALRDPDRWAGWFRRVTVTAAVDLHRRRGNGRLMPLGEVENLDELLPSTDVHHAVAARDEVWRLIGCLSTDDRALLVLRFAYDLELPDIADALGIPLGTAKSRLHRVLARLRADLESQNGPRRSNS